MPDPLIAHVIGTVSLLIAATLIVASFAVVQQLNYVQMLNAMLSEAAEACARQIVELASIHTLGGGEYTYMTLVLPRSLGGQPYSLTLENLAENKIMVVAQLQLHRQVRIVVTPNFGQAPVTAVPATIRFKDLIISPTILLPTPQGWKAALVAVRSGNSILVGFTMQSPVLTSLIGPPNFMFVNWSLKLEGLAGSQQDFVFAVWNKGGTGTATINVYNDANQLVDSITITAESGGIVMNKLTLKLPFERGVYEWRVECRHGADLHDSRTFLVVSKQPNIVIRSYDATISGPPRSPAKLSFVLENVGDYDGTAEVFLNGTRVGSYEMTAGEQRAHTLDVQLPEGSGSRIWTLLVKTLETEKVDERQIAIFVRGSDAPYISWINTTIEGLVGWETKICVRVSNPDGKPYTVSLQLNGSLVKSDVIVPEGGTWINFTVSLPSARGVYKWNVSLVSSGSLLDTRIIELRVIDFIRIDRTAIFYSTFDSNLPSSDWTNIGGEWRVERGVLKGDDRSNKNNRDGFCSVDKIGKNEIVGRCAVVYYWKKDFYSFVVTRGSFAALVHIRFDASDKNFGQGFALLKESFDPLKGPMYAVTLYRRRNKEATIMLETFDGLWRSLNSRSLGAIEDGWYTLFVNIAYRGQSLSITYDVYRGDISLLGSRQDFMLSDFVPRYLGLFVSNGTGNFDNVVLAVGDPRYVVVRGLPSGWGVELHSGGRCLARGVASDGDEIYLLVMNSPILRNVKIWLIDPYGRQLELQSLSQLNDLIGGDILVFSHQKG